MKVVTIKSFREAVFHSTLLIDKNIPSTSALEHGEKQNCSKGHFTRQNFNLYEILKNHLFINRLNKSDVKNILRKIMTLFSLPGLS